MNRPRLHLLLGAAVALTVAISGCGGTVNTGAETSVPTTDVTTVDPSGNRYAGAAKCIGCHQQNQSIGAPQVAAYLESKHLLHSTHVAAEEPECLRCHDPVGDGPSMEQFVDVSYIPDDGLAAVGCEACHGAGGQHYGKGPIPDGKPNYMSCGGSNITTETTRCHNALIDDPVAGAEGTANHTNYHSEGMNILPEYLESAHSRAEAGYVANEAETKCTRCHTDEGARAYVNIVSADQLSSAVQLPEWGEGSVIQCRTCHEAHNPGKLLKEASSSASAEYNTCTHCHQSATTKLSGDRWTDLPGSATTDGGVVTSSGTTELMYHGQRWNRIIATTHYDDPSTTAKTEGFIVRQKVAGAVWDRSCRDCHNVHAANLTIAKEWASSGHAGKVGPGEIEVTTTTTEVGKPDVITTVTQVDPATAKGAAVLAQKSLGNDRTLTMTKAVQQAGTTEAPLTEDDWDSSGQQACQRCHTSTGFKNYATAKTSGVWDPAAYNAAKNDFTHLNGWKGTKNAETGVFSAITSSGQNELLYCWACHSNNEGGLNNPGAITDLGYNTKVKAGEAAATVVKFALPNIGESNVCALCHSGRGNFFKLDTNGEIAKLTPTTVVTTGAATKTHYYGSAGTIFQANTRIGYEYAGVSANASNVPQPNAYYADPSAYAHDTAGGTDEGPCVVCHMNGDDHTFDVIGKDYARIGTAAELSANTPPALTETKKINAAATCNAFTCHASNMSIDVLETRKGGYEDALEALKLAIYTKTGGTGEGGGVDATGILFDATYPYFYRDLNDNGVLDGTEISAPAALNWGDMGTYGAAHNLNFLLHEPGAFAHNSTYAKRLIFDSIYWCQHATVTNMMNNQGTINLTGFLEANKWISGTANPADDFPARNGTHPSD